MKSKDEMRETVDELKTNNVVVAGAMVDPEKAIRAFIDAGDEDAKQALKDAARRHVCDLVHEGSADGHEAYQLVNKEAELTF